MLAQTRVCIVGLGLMGGSLALALRGKVGRLTAVDSHAATRQQALQQNLVEEITADFAAAARTTDLIIFATPVRTILHLLAQLPAVRPDGCLVMDIGSTKAAICAAMSELPEHFAAIGGHPMCGKETAGLAAAISDLYAGQTFILCQNGRTIPQIESLAQEMVTAISAQPLWLLPEEHDRLVAAVSHLPYLVAATLMHTAVALHDERAWPVSAAGFRDTSRLAGSDPYMMRDILLTNKTAVLEQLAQYQAHLQEVTNLLQTGNETELAAWLQEKQAGRQSYLRWKDGKQ
jgi:prephenate dehydrogenase